MEATTTITASSSVALPSDFLEARRVYVNASPYPVLEYLTPDVFYTTYANGEYGTPANYTIEGGNLLIGPAPSSGSLALSYYQQIPPLATNSTNWLLDSNPDIYLYAALSELSGYVRDPQAVQEWESKLAVSISTLKKSDGRWSGNNIRVVAA